MHDPPAQNCSILPEPTTLSFPFHSVRTVHPHKNLVHRYLRGGALVVGEQPQGVDQRTSDIAFTITFIYVMTIIVRTKVVESDASD